ncbi:MAG: type II secretion system protein GspG [Armatimonadetes bacterium]|nr:type II secretion system protein GspG [Armatimonadota bacterium]
MKRLRKGFTLTEIMTVVSIIGLLSAMAVPQYMTSVRRSRENSLRATLAVVRSAVDAYRNDTGAFPAAISDLSSTSAPASGLSSTAATVTITSSDWRGPYLRAVPTDPVSGSAFTYSTTSGTVGNVSSSASGNDSRGTAFSTY